MLRCLVAIAAIMTGLFSCATQQPPVVSRSFDYRIAARNAPLGTVFVADAGAIKCAAHFVYSVQYPTILANDNDLEFWCRDGDVRLQFASIGHPGSYRTAVANIDGKLFEFSTQSTYEGGRWWNNNLPIVLSAGGLLSVQPSGNGRIVVVEGYPKCPGVSLFGPGGYRGTVSENGRAFVDRDIVLVVAQLHPFTGKLLPSRTTEYSKIALKKLSDDNVNLYAILPFADGYLFGGATEGYRTKEQRCALLYWISREGTFDNGRSLRADGYEPALWAQRVGSITVLSGRVCASTGNLSGFPYDPRKHLSLTPEQARQYDTIYCAVLKKPRHGKRPATARGPYDL